MTRYFSSTSFIAGTMFGLLIAGIWFSHGDTIGTFSRPATLSETSSSVLSVISQAAGSEVVVDTIQVPITGVWVAVRELEGEVLGNVLGAARISGTHTAFSVPLLRATEPGRTYAIELYRDDNDGVFDVAANSVYIDFDTSAPVIVHFNTTE